MATLTVTDDQNGTTATAAIAGSAGGTNVVYVGSVSGQVGPVAFNPSAMRVGDGSVVLAFPPALYFAYLTVNGVTQTQGMYYFAVTSPLQAVATRVRTAIIDTLKLLPYPPFQRIYSQMWPDPSNVTFPCTQVTIDGLQETQEQGLSTRDDWGRPAKIMIADRHSKRDHDKLPDYELWREKAIRCFVNQRLEGLPESKICRIEPYVIVDPSQPQFEHMVAGFVVRAITREPRGIGV